MLEGILLGLCGGAFGVAAATVFLNQSLITFGSEGQMLTIVPRASVMLSGLIVSLILGAVAGLVPAVVAIRQPMVRSLNG